MCSETVIGKSGGQENQATSLSCFPSVALSPSLILTSSRIFNLVVFSISSEHRIPNLQTIASIEWKRPLRGFLFQYFAI